jgi:hypothetical protein
MKILADVGLFFFLGCEVSDVNGWPSPRGR